MSGLAMATVLANGACFGTTSGARSPCMRVGTVSLPARGPYPARRGRAMRPAAMADVGMLLAEAGKPGSVDAPIGVIIGAAVVVTIASLLSGYLLKPGADAAEKIFERDAKSGRKR